MPNTPPASPTRRKATFSLPPAPVRSSLKKPALTTHALATHNGASSSTSHLPTTANLTHMDGRHGRDERSSRNWEIAHARNVASAVQQDLFPTSKYHQFGDTTAIRKARKKAHLEERKRPSQQVVPTPKLEDTKPVRRPSKTLTSKVADKGRDTLQQLPHFDLTQRIIDKLKKLVSLIEESKKDCFDARNERGFLANPDHDKHFEQAILTAEANVDFIQDSLISPDTLGKVNDYVLELTTARTLWVRTDDLYKKQLEATKLHDLVEKAHDANPSSKIINRALKKAKFAYLCATNELEAGPSLENRPTIATLFNRQRPNTLWKTEIDDSVGTSGTVNRNHSSLSPCRR